MKRILIGIPALALALWVGAIVYLKANERTLVFRAESARGPLVEPKAPFQPPHTRVEFPSADGTTLVGWVIPAAQPDSSGTWVLVCHGNSHNLSQREEPEFYSYLRALGVNILTFDYRGFGESGGVPDEAGSYADTRAAFDLITQKYGVPSQRVVIYGHSLGTGMATQLASVVDAGALVLQAPYTSIPDIGAKRYPWLPVRQVAGYRFPSIERIREVREPLLVMHSPADSTIPLAMGERIHLAGASTDKRFMHIEGGHNLAFRVDSAVFFRAFRQMVATVNSSATRAATAAPTAVDTAASRTRASRG